MDYRDFPFTTCCKSKIYVNKLHRYILISNQYKIGINKGVNTIKAGEVDNKFGPRQFGGVLCFFEFSQQLLVRLG